MSTHAWSVPTSNYSLALALAQMNKTIGDEGITVDFSIIKVYTSN